MRWPSVFVGLGVLAACGDPLSGPFDGLPVDGDFTALVGAPVHVARDRYGIAHISASTIADAAYARGYVMAHDRLPQMDILQAMVDAMTHLESAQGFGTADPGAWRWGKLHRLTITPLFSNPALNLPAPTDPDAAGFGFPRAGDNFVMSRSDQGWADLAYSPFADGPAHRFLAEARPGQPITVSWALPGGVIYDRRSSHYRDLLDTYYLPNKHFDAPSSLDQIVAAGESRWVFH